jgi:hypothetical protein
MTEPEGISVEFESPSGERLRFDWPLERLESLDGTESEPVWERAGELDWDEIDLLRAFSGRLGDGRAVAVAALRPAGADGHGDDAVAGVLVTDGEPKALAATLLSTEYGPGGAVRRVGLELYPEDQGLPLRVAGDVTGIERLGEGGTERTRVALALRAGSEGAGILDIIRPE